MTFFVQKAKLQKNNKLCGCIQIYFVSQHKTDRG